MGYYPAEIHGAVIKLDIKIEGAFFQEPVNNTLQIFLKLLFL